MNQRKAGLLALGLFTLVAILHVISMQNIAAIPENVLLYSRWIFIASLVLFGIYKRSLTTWILVAMAIGVEIGIDFPKARRT